MTRSPVEDSEAFSATYWSSIYNAHNQEAVKTGLSPSKGAGDFEIDTTQGEAIVGGTLTGTINAQSPAVTLNSSDSEDRVDLVSVNASGTIAATTGTAAADPVAPDIPNNEVLIAAVLVEGGASSLASAGSKIADYRTLYDTTPSFEEVHDGTASSSKRLGFTSTATEIYDDAATQAADFADGSHYRIFARSGIPFEVRDAALGGPGVTYTAGASAPNTWDWNNHDFTNVNAASAASLTLGSGSSVAGLISAALANGEIWADDGNVYTDMSDAESAATNMLVIGPGTFTSDTDFAGNEALRVSTTGLTVLGAGKNTILDGGANNGVSIVAENVLLSHLTAQCTAGGGNSVRAVEIAGASGNNCEATHIWIDASDEDGIRVTGNRNRLVSINIDSANVDGDDIGIEGDNNIADDIIGGVNDAGTGNSVGQTA